MDILQFRPSSHSTDCTIVATYPSEKIARKVEDKVGGYRFGDKIAYRVSNGTWEDVEEITGELGSFDNRDVLVYENYQELEVEVTLPKGATAESMPLLLTPDQIEIVRELSQLCEPRKETVDSATEKIVFHYQGERIFYDMDNTWLNEELFFFKGKEYFPGKEIKVKVIEDI